MVLMMCGNKSETSFDKYCLYSWYMSTTMMGNSASTFSEWVDFGSMLNWNTTTQHFYFILTTHTWAQSMLCSYRLLRLRSRFFYGYWRHRVTAFKHGRKVEVIQIFHFNRRSWFEHVINMFRKLLIALRYIILPIAKRIDWSRDKRKN